MCINRIFRNVPGWKTTTLHSTEEVLGTLDWLANKKWATRGHSRCWGDLYPKIDREPLDKVKDREKKIELESNSISQFQSIGKTVLPKGEVPKLNSKINTLMLLQHYGVPTRLLDWSKSPYISAFFSVYENENNDGELWAFSLDEYHKRAPKQWENEPDIPPSSPSETRYIPAFNNIAPDHEFFICLEERMPQYHKTENTRIEAQKGFFTLASNFGRDHSKSIIKLFNSDNNFYQHYIIKSGIKSQLEKIIEERKENVNLAKLFPDFEGAAKVVKFNMYKNARKLNNP